jgi:hypothetical protein
MEERSMNFDELKAELVAYGRARWLEEPAAFRALAEALGIELPPDVGYTAISPDGELVPVD